MTKSVWKKRELIGKLELDCLKDGSLVILKAYKKIWNDGTVCLDIMKYLQFKDGKEQTFYPIQHIQVPWILARPFLALFLKEKT